MDKLEEHIRKNREELDRYDQPSGTWRKIERELYDEKSIWKHWFSIAAMIVVVLGSALILFRPQHRSSGAVSGKNTFQLKETEIYYTNLVNSLYSEATPLLIKNPEVKQELNSDLSQIDSICIDIRRDLKDNVSNQEVVEALIRNYRIKIEILEQMLTVLKENENNPEKKKSHEL